jgi:Fic family protein
MDIKEFKAGAYVERFRYKAFMPSKINENWAWTDNRLNTLLAEASHALGSLNAFSLYVPNVDRFIQMHVVKEATESSRIEGTKTEFEEAFTGKSDIPPERRDDWQEVQNYIEAMNYAVGRLKELPVSTRLLKETHRILLSKGRGSLKEPGEYRRSQNWIGGRTIEGASFVPPPADAVGELMGDLENFLYNEAIEVPPIVRIAIAHYQFETIHPFLDGNGRMGRLLITLYLVGRGLLARPTLYLSEYLERNRDTYFRELVSVRTSNDLARWLRFFLTTVTRTAEKGISTFGKIQALREDVEGRRLVQLRKKFSQAKGLLDLLYRNPRVTATSVAGALHIAPATANSLLADLVRLKILVETTGGKRNRVFLFRDYVDLFS